MPRAISLRSDFTGSRLRVLARQSKDAGQARRLLALAVIYEGGSRTEAARLGDVTLQIVRDWGLEPHEVAYVGDSTVDLATAEAGGLIPLIFSWGYGTPEGIQLLGSVNHFFDAVADLRNS